MDVSDVTFFPSG